VSIGCLALWVSDLERATRFYRDGLGLDVIARVTTPEILEVIVGRKGFGSQLMLAHRVGEDGKVDPSGFWKTYLSTDDLTGDIARAVNAGATVGTEPTLMAQFHMTIAVLADPDGYLLELGQVQTG
jgi:catechol 2,3-dioxygenase-like lactoylglutathione lyase family enzyme